MYAWLIRTQNRKLLWLVMLALILLVSASDISLMMGLSNQLLTRRESYSQRGKYSQIEKELLRIIFAIQSSIDLFMEDISLYRLQTIVRYSWF